MSKYVVFRQGQISPTQVDGSTREEAEQAAAVLCRYDNRPYVVAEVVSEAIPEYSSVLIRRMDSPSYTRRVNFEYFEGVKGGY